MFDKSKYIVSHKKSLKKKEKLKCKTKNRNLGRNIELTGHLPEQIGDLSRLQACT